MKKFTAYVNVLSPPQRTVGLPAASFELQLLEVAVKGKKAFETHKEHAKYGGNKREMCNEIFEEIDGNLKLLQERARKLVVRMKEQTDKEHYNRALGVHFHFLELSSSRVNADFSISQPGQRESTDFSISPSRPRYSTDVSSSHLRVSTDVSSIPQSYSIDEKLDEMLCIELPLTLDDESSSPPKESGAKTLQGEPSVYSVYREGPSIFEPPTKSDEGISPGLLLPGQTTSGLSVSFGEESEGEDFEYFVNNEDTMSPGSRSLRILSTEESMEGVVWDYADVKVDFSSETQHQVLGSFPGKDFKHPITWTVDTITNKATNIADLRSKYEVVIEGEFRKRCRGHKWRDYYGFFLDSGVMIYFRNRVYKKVVDFRKCIVSVPKSKRPRLNVEELSIDSKETAWLLEFSSAKHLNTWHEAILRFSNGLKNKKGVRRSLGSPKD